MATLNELGHVLQDEIGDWVCVRVSPANCAQCDKLILLSVSVEAPKYRTLTWETVRVENWELSQLSTSEFQDVVEMRVREAAQKCAARLGLVRALEEGE